MRYYAGVSGVPAVPSLAYSLIRIQEGNERSVTMLVIGNLSKNGSFDLPSWPDISHLLYLFSSTEIRSSVADFSFVRKFI